MIKLKPVEIRRLYKQHKHELEIVLILDNIQFAQNTASIFRIADAFKVREIICSGITATPPFGTKLQKVSREKERSVKWSSTTSLVESIGKLKKKGFEIVTTYPTDQAVTTYDFKQINRSNKLAIILSNEVHGISNKVLEYVDHSVYVPLYGKYSSVNIAIETALWLQSITIS